MTRRRKPFAVYWLAEADPNVHAIVRYDGDPDVFAALAHDWLWKGNIDGRYDYPIGICPPKPRLWRWSPTPWGEHPLTLYPASAGRGAWLGAELKVARIGCADCQRLDGQGHSDWCLNYGITALMTLQFRGDRKKMGSYGTPEVVHAVRWRAERSPGLPAGTPGPSLCGMPRFDPVTSPAWSVGGGEIPANVRGCWLCQKVARDQFPGLAIHGTLPLAAAFAGDGIPLAPHLVAEVAVKASNRTADPAMVRR